MLNKDIKQTFQGQLCKPVLTYLHKKSLRKRVHEKAKKTTLCPYCGELNGNLKLITFIIKFFK
jgi:DNA-directed RNA polymerase III subunit RPC1